MIKTKRSPCKASQAISSAGWLTISAEGQNDRNHRRFGWGGVLQVTQPILVAVYCLLNASDKGDCAREGEGEFANGAEGSH